MSIPKSAKKSKKKPSVISTVKRVVSAVDISRKLAKCECGEMCKRHSSGHVRKVMKIDKEGPYVQPEIYSKHYCQTCKKIFSYRGTKQGRYPEVIKTSARKLDLKGMTLPSIQGALLAQYKLRVPTTTIHEWLL